MRQAGVNLREVMDALSNSNINVGGKVLEENGMEFVVRGIGLVNSLDDLKHIAVRMQNGTADLFARTSRRFRWEEISGVELSTLTATRWWRRRGGHEDGENAMRVIERVKEKIAQIGPSLPKGREHRAIL